MAEVTSIVAWYLATAYGRWEGPGTIPFYADRARVGHFAVDLDALSARDPAAIFRLLITLSSYQSRRDVDVMAIQRGMSVSTVKALTSPTRLRVLAERSRCAHMQDASSFDGSCDVRRDFERACGTCSTRPRSACHVKEASVAFGRMGDFGKMPTSAWLHLGARGFDGWFSEVMDARLDPHERALDMVARVATIYRIGVKLASMFVTALSVPELGALAPWSPEINGSRIVVVDGNVARAIGMWRRPGATRTYESHSRWLGALSEQIDLSRLRNDLPRFSPRFVQQAIYAFRSSSNRRAQGDRCASQACESCPSRICPFAGRARVRVGSKTVSVRAP